MTMIELSPTRLLVKALILIRVIAAMIHAAFQAWIIMLALCGPLAAQNAGVNVIIVVGM
jgi:hypothetical protein